MSRQRAIADWVADAVDGERGALARILSMIEAAGAEAASVQRELAASTERGFVVGVTGAPGAGKSTLVGSLLRLLRSREERVAVLAVDPSSPFSRGALLGDRLRMTGGGRDPGVYIRSMASRGQQGGLAATTQTAASVLEACGWPWIVIETVGAGQVEVDIAAAADTTVVVLNPGWGDAVQANKAGLMEVGDVFVLNKADRPGCAETRRDLEALLAGRCAEQPEVPVVETVATEDRGVGELLAALVAHRESLSRSGTLAERRRERLAQLVRLTLRARLEAQVQEISESASFAEEVDRLADGATSVPDVIERLLARLRR